MEKLGMPKASVGRAVESDMSRQDVDGESLVPRWKMPTAEEVENKLKSEEGGEVGGGWIVGNVMDLGEEETGTRRPGCRSKCWV